ncbi:hypothetical protein IG631_22987 [Alternaria alternata]|nr:hypothetical protein IG631_22987 [Alternaria alternata]
MKYVFVVAVSGKRTCGSRLTADNPGIVYRQYIADRAKKASRQEIRLMWRHAGIVRWGRFMVATTSCAISRRQPRRACLPTCVPNARVNLGLLPRFFYLANPIDLTCRYRSTTKSWDGNRQHSVQQA